ncbi:hypothetical protein BSKO_03881 [Bryopsis sp. KO-2023]|nr:hypothetical protein BSKO_03881 [Bryopsis sp. KO-2023]
MEGAECEVTKLLKDLLSKEESDESRLKGLEAFKPQPTDIFVVSPQKCGTTWMQQIVHGLRSKGNMDFDAIENVIPYVEMAHDYGYGDLEKEQGFSPRVYKAHVWYPHCPKGAGKYVFVLRDPEPAGVSFYHFLNGWIFEKDVATIDQFLETFYLSRGPAESILQNASYWDIISTWYAHRNDPNVLWMHYEDMLDDLPKCVELISNFLGIGVGDSELLELVEEQSTFDFMKAHWEKFDERPLKEVFNTFWGQPSNAGTNGQNSKVRQGKRAKVKFSDKIQKQFNLKWETTVKPATGYASYNELREGVNKELGRNFRVKTDV